jgi:microcompartment protein CcmK/EutM
MRIAEVIGTVILSRAHPALARARWIIGVPFSLKALRQDAVPDGEDVVIFDSLGAGNGHQIGFSEGGEAAVPFLPERKPVDAYCACILDQLTIHSRSEGDSHETNKPLRKG